MDLNEYVKSVSLEDFGHPFLHQAFWNKRLRTTGGRFFPEDCHLDFNPRYYDAPILEVFRGIVRHELCHYHLYRMGRGYRHRDKDFQNLLTAVGGLRHAPSLPEQTRRKHYLCQSCRTEFWRKYRINTDRYVCGVCLGSLIFQGDI